MVVVEDGDKSTKLGGKVGIFWRRRRSGRLNDNRCVYGKISGQRRRLSGGQGSEEYEVLDNDNITNQLCNDLLPPRTRGFYFGKLMQIVRK